ncbi:hypothetical protein B0H15DRAFT_957934 [Mycena belliarum]|uniref:Uncharacterized protein n=1 Tax=Mycena belliarum TaxID=1033014 RepID=A0AAD6TLX9_9AGAR|nr:hypothetical protein B0H15DRAFT_957934 [Mycena belliae]
MEARVRRAFLTFVGILYASIGFTLSVVSTIFRLFVPLHQARSADVTIELLSRRRSMKHRRRSALSTTTNSSISTATSAGSTTSSDASSHTKSETKQNAIRHRVVIEPHNLAESGDERPAFRSAAREPRRRSESTPPSPAPWADSHVEHRRASLDHSADENDPSPRSSTSKCPTTGFHLRALSFDGRPGIHATRSLSFMRSKGRRSSAGLADYVLPPVHAEKRASGSHLFAPLLHRRKSHATETDASAPEEEASRPSISSQDSGHYSHPAPRRSQTLRTQPYEAPYFFPAPGSEAAEGYVAPRRPVRGKTLHPEELAPQGAPGSTLYSPTET